MKGLLYLIAMGLSAQLVHADWGLMMYPGSGHMFWNFGFIGIFSMLVFWGAVIFFIYWLVKKSGSKEPLEILKEKYAKGEITKKEFEEKKKELEK